MTTPASEMTVGALQVPTELLPRIVAALRSQYAGALVAETSDAAVPAAVLQWVISSALETHEMSVATQGLEAELQAVREDRMQEAERARQKARDAAQAIRHGRTPAKKAAAAKK
jgi:hypothetical protein